MLGLDEKIAYVDYTTFQGLGATKPPLQQKADVKV